MQSLAQSPWAVRNAIPLAPRRQHPDARRDREPARPGRRLVRGWPAYLRRAGIAHLVVRNDLDAGADVPDPVLVHQALADSPGIERVAAFGPKIGGEAHITDDDGNRLLVNGGWQDNYPAVEIFAVTDATGSTSTPPAVAAESVPVVVGGPEDLLDLADLGLLDDQPTELAADADGQTAPEGPVILTDGLRETERNFGRVHDGSSQTLGAGDPVRLQKPTLDYELEDAATWSTRAVYSGGQPSASSSQSDVNAPGTVQPGRMP